jgi:hypothetical protein
MDASGWAIDRKYLQPRPMEETWSDLVFPIEQPAPRDFRIWKDAIPQIQALRGRLHLARYVQQGHKIWEWRHDLEKSKLYHCKGKLVDIYEPSQFEGARTRANQYSQTRHDQATIRQTKYGGRSRARNLQDHLLHQHAPPNHTTRDIHGCTLGMGMHLDVGGHAPDWG